MTYKEIFEAEKRRTIQDIYEIHFYKEGLWWKAWEWSVFLYENFMSKSDFIKDKKILNILKKFTNQHSDGSIVIIGMPIEAFDNFLPNINNFKIIDEKEIIFDLSKHKEIYDKINSYLTLDNYEEFLKLWKDNLPITNCSNKKIKMIDNATKSNITIEDIINEIKRYPIENKTLIENTQFIAKIKEKIMNIT